ncbi:hypothetical protein DICVIV_13894 [Dictyocaulus viviparus]|uniref:Uncharacterized protein n=1 Tax=Dictyocaulus viviparus TaxID=29172 RepID=A0A0D8X6P0_DICVI|nr:hypothetical protein DICVIV_13894 [Dictyocaulus viviparus]
MNFSCQLLNIYANELSLIFRLRYRLMRAKTQLKRFDDMKNRVGSGTITGIRLAPNEQVLRAVCKCNAEATLYREFYRVAAMSPIAFECDAITDSYNRMPPTPSM